MSQVPAEEGKGAILIDQGSRGHKVAGGRGVIPQRNALQSGCGGGGAERIG